MHDEIQRVLLHVKGQHFVRCFEDLNDIFKCYVHFQILFAECLKEKRILNGKYEIDGLIFLNYNETGQTR